MEGYGVYLTQRQLDEAVDNSGNSPTKLVRNLMNVFFKPKVLAASSAFGLRKHPSLDKIISACICKHDIYLSHACLQRPGNEFPLVFLCFFLYDSVYRLGIA